jgi:hypothetical protein
VGEGHYQLAQINIARTLAPLDDPLMEGFVAQLDEINALAEQSPGFVWRLKTDNGASSSYVRAYEDDRIIVNMSVWKSVQALYNYVYATAHAKVFRNRRRWFKAMGTRVVALWWIPAGSIPTIADGRARLEALDHHGPTEYAFNFKHPFPPPECEAAQTRRP